MASIINFLMSMSHCRHDEWIVDSGATDHFIANKKLLQNNINLDISKKKKVYLSTGKKTDITT